MRLRRRGARILPSCRMQKEAKMVKNIERKKKEKEERRGEMR
jgi:hypothetical protein